MLKRHKQRFLGELHVDQQKLRAQLEVLRSDVEAFAELGDIAQVLLALPLINASFQTSAHCCLPCTRHCQLSQILPSAACSAAHHYIIRVVQGSWSLPHSSP